MPPKSQPVLRAPVPQWHNVSTDDSLQDYQVTDYLKKKGFTKTEAVFRQETAYLGPDGRPAQRSEDPGPKKYLKAFVLLRNWIDNNLDIYKVSATRLMTCLAVD
jgi:transcription initiation factor TFIID subunit 5